MHSLVGDLGRLLRFSRQTASVFTSASVFTIRVMTKKPINIRVDAELWERVRSLAEEKGTTATALVERGLREVVVRDAPLDEVVEKHKAVPPFEGFTSEGHPAIGQGGVTGALKSVYVEPCPYTARQLQGKTGLPLATCQRHIDNGTWRELL